MRKSLSAVIALLMLGLGALVVSVPAQASSSTTSGATTLPLPPDANGEMFWSPYICVEPGAGIPDAISDQTYYRLAYLAQQWNLRANGAIALDYSTDCAADGYPPSRRMVIGLYSSTASVCNYLKNGQTDYYEGMYRWTNGPAVYINTANAGCVSSQTRRDHIVSASIGYLLGLQNLNSSGYNSRVMNFTTWSWDNVPLPDSNSGLTLIYIYSCKYGGC
jgi:hypothetical protein